MMPLVAALGIALCQTSIDKLKSVDVFPDTPDNHWAFEALAALRSVGLTLGLPDSLVRGIPPKTFEVKLETVWKTVTDNLPILKSAVQAEIN